jgi:hypothetical protein
MWNWCWGMIVWVLVGGKGIGNWTECVEVGIDTWDVSRKPSLSWNSWKSWKSCLGISRFGPQLLFVLLFPHTDAKTLYNKMSLC